MKIQICIKSVYGNTLIYPACPKAELFAKLTGKKTFSHADLIHIEALGFLIEQVPAYKLVA